MISVTKMLVIEIHGDFPIIFIQRVHIHEMHTYQKTDQSNPNLKKELENHEFIQQSRGLLNKSQFLTGFSLTHEKGEGEIIENQCDIIEVHEIPFEKTDYKDRETSHQIHGHYVLEILERVS